MSDKSNSTDALSSSVTMRPQAEDGLSAHGWMRVECRDRDGKLKWVEEGPNLIVTAGRNDLLDKTLAGSGYTAAWYVGLIDNAAFSAIAAGDVMSSHAGWAEWEAYDEAARQTMAFSAASSGSKATSANNTFTVAAGGDGDTVNGAFVTTVSTKGGTTGTLFAAKSFAVARLVATGDTLNVGYTATLTAS